MKQIGNIEGTAVSLPRADVDTDQIIPQNYLKRTERSGYGQFLFGSWAQDPSFPLNEAARAGAKVLIVGSNFGCGSSREHAVWAVMDRGFEVVIGPSFADIFANNAANNGLLLVRLTETEMDRIYEIATDPTAVFEVSLERCQVRFNDEAWGFYVEPEVRRRLMRGLDLIGVTLEHEEAISAFEAAGQ